MIFMFCKTKIGFIASFFRFPLVRFGEVKSIAQGHQLKGSHTGIWTQSIGFFFPKPHSSIEGQFNLEIVVLPPLC